MKAILLLINLLIITISSNASTWDNFTKEEKLLITTIIKQNGSDQFVEVSKGSNTAYKTVIEFTHKMYILEKTKIEYVYVLEDEDWRRIYSPDITYSYDASTINAYVFNFDEGKEQQRIDIEPINGTPGYTLYYDDFLWDNRIQAFVYYNEDTEIIVGDSYILYSDSRDTLKFNILECDY